MYKGGEAYISPNHKATDFLALNLQIGSDRTKWDKAIAMFQERMETRYLNVITGLLGDPENNGFAIMALNCLLIDVFYQFNDPYNIREVARRREQAARGNRVCYKEFLIQEMPEIFTPDTANYFYKDIRCGILHSAQTKHGSQLAYNQTYVLEVFDGDKIRVDVSGFSQRLRAYYEKYVNQLKSGDEVKRKAFIKQMKKICTQ